MSFRLSRQDRTNLLAALVTLVVAAGINAQVPPPKELPSLPSPGGPQPAVPTPVPVPLPNNFQFVPPPPPPFPVASPRFTFKVDVKAPLSDLLPAAPKTPAKLPAWTNEDLAKVSEVTFADPVAKDIDRMKAMERIAHVLAKVNHVDRQRTDGFLLALIEQRGDLRGLPILMGEECRTREEQARTFRELAEIVNRALAQCKGNANNTLSTPSHFTRDDQLWATMANVNAAAQRGGLKNSGLAITSTNKDHVSVAMVAALMQILMPEAEQYRLGLAKFLGTVPHPDATRALARLAIFSSEDDVRAAAIEGLKPRREKDYTEILLQGFTYPLPAVAKRAAEAVVKLERKDLFETLVQVLESPDPRLPVTKKREGKEVNVVRELVKVNHHRNCVLCHAPGNTESLPEGVLTVAVPLPNEPLPKPSQGGYGTMPPSPDIVVRLDMTYLRQDFSQMMRVATPEPWPEMQRFDFLVRTRTLTPAEVQAYEACCAEDEPGQLSPYRRAALFALRELTGRDTEPTASAWRKVLKLPKQTS